MRESPSTQPFDGYSLASRHALCYDDMARIVQWLPRLSPLYRIARGICYEGMLSRKEFYESLYAFNLLAPLLAQQRYIHELVAGHGFFSLIAALLLPGKRFLYLYDQRRPASFERLLELIARYYPYVKCRIRYHCGQLQQHEIIEPKGFVVGIHACGQLSDWIIDRAISGSHIVAVMPCCVDRSQLQHVHQFEEPVPHKELIEQSYAIRARFLSDHGYQVIFKSIPAVLTPYNRVILGVSANEVKTEMTQFPERFLLPLPALSIHA